ncbi:MAG: UDP-N-acetylglucosamine 1-carboxyvinyltransferase, partial [Oscillospiraceae bacterium]
NVEEYDDAIRVSKGKMPLEKINIKTMPHPGFPTDMQPQMVAMLSCANGASIITEGVWDNRFRYVDELRRMGASIQVDGKIAVVQGVEKLTGAPVKATDLRAGAAMLIAGFMADGETTIEDIHHIVRGYDDIVVKLKKIGADIKKIDVPDDEISKAQ